MIESDRIAPGIVRLTGPIGPDIHPDEVRENWCRPCPLYAVRPTAACTGLLSSADRRTIMQATIRLGLIPPDHITAGTIFHCGQKANELTSR